MSGSASSAPPNAPVWPPARLRVVRSCPTASPASARPTRRWVCANLVPGRSYIRCTPMVAGAATTPSSTVSQGAPPIPVYQTTVELVKCDFADFDEGWDNLRTRPVT